MDSKPLPAIPTSLQATKLSVGAREHRGRFIRHILTEGQASSLENWACALEDSLDQLGDSIDRGGWLSGLKRARIAGKGKFNAVKLQKPSAEDAKVDTGKGKGRLSVSGSFSSHEQQDSMVSSTEEVDKVPQILEQIRSLVSQPIIPSPTPTPKHLLLCLKPLGSRIALPAEDSGFDLIPANVGCMFTAGTFVLPEGPEDAASHFLCGFNKWDTTAESHGRIVGGTFVFKGVTTPIQQQTLAKVLRLSIYLHLSLILEQQFLLDSSIRLFFPRPPIPAPSPSVATGAELISKQRNSFLPNGLFSFFSKKNIARSSSYNSLEHRSGSLDLPPRSPILDKVIAASPDGSRLRRFSFISEARPSFFRAPGAKEDSEHTFVSALKRVEESKGLLSTSMGTVFTPPSLLVDFAEKEKKRPNWRLRGHEKAGLASILGWDGRDSQGKGMSGTLGFVRQQTFSVLVSEYVPRVPGSAPSGSDAASIASEQSVLSVTPPHLRYSPCGRPKLVTYQFYASDQSKDRVLGEVLLNLAATAEEPCEQPGCQSTISQHEVRYIHGSVRIVVNVESRAEEEKPVEEDGGISVWLSCGVCGAKSQRKGMHDGTYLMSFGKFLELLVYSPAICTPTPQLCEHTRPPPSPWQGDDYPLPRSRLNIVRHFSTKSHTISFKIFPLEDIFEIRVPRLQIVRGAGDRSARNSLTKDDRDIEHSSEEEKKLLRREIKTWWEAVADHMDRLELKLAGEATTPSAKALPRLPSSDDAYEEFDYSPPLPTPLSPSVSGLPPLPPSVPNSPARITELKEYFPRVASSLSVSSQSESSSATATPGGYGLREPTLLLSNLRQTFHRTEQSLYSQLSRTPVTSLNDVRRAFLSSARGAERRLQAWQKKHLVRTGKAPEKVTAEEPEWWGKTCHVVPAGNVVVREDDWGSIIAFTMSTPDYHRELANMSILRTTSTAQDSLAPSTPESNPPSFFAAATGFQLFKPSAQSPDPDADGVVWHEPEAYSAVITRKEHPRDPASLLSFREVLRQKSPVDGSGLLSGSRFGSLGSASLKAAGIGTPPSAWSKPDVQISMQAADGEVNGLPENGESVGKMLQEIDTISNDSRPGSSMSSHHTSSGFADAHIKRGKASSLISVESDATVGPDNGSTLHLSIPPEVPEKDDVRTPSAQSSSSFATTFTNGLAQAMRFVINNSDLTRPTSPSLKNHHGLLSTDAANIDERPHIKYDWTIGKRLKFSCTVYYAKQFDSLRKRCGIDDIFLKSLSRSTNWAAEGGKSKSNFWKTSDDRFIIKTLVNAWNVADLQVLIELAPSYFRYMDTSASKATVLAKLIGFYTVEIRNLETGNVQSKADLLVMENLFYGQKVVKTFDLKGIQGRKVKAGAQASSTNSKTLFDGEWIEGQQQTLTLVRPHSKAVLQEAIKSDADFLAKSNIMDYSLLVGLDEEHKQIACGLVDTIGSYTFAKTLEYKAKQGLSSGKEVTVVPPAEYQDRFVSALDGYFLPCPDKWTRSSEDSQTLSDPNLLPSVL